MTVYQTFRSGIISKYPYVSFPNVPLLRIPPSKRNPKGGTFIGNPAGGCPLKIYGHDRLLFLRPVIVFCLFLIISQPSLAQSAADSAAIRATALNYVEGWYEGNAERMAKALHPELAKRIMVKDDVTGKEWLDHMGAEKLIRGTLRAFGKETPKDQQQKDVYILDMYQNAASVKAIMSGWIDYMHMAKWNGEWKIVNVLWEYKPRPKTN